MFIKNTLHPEYTFYINTDKMFEKNKSFNLEKSLEVKDICLVFKIFVSSRPQKGE